MRFDKKLRTRLAALAVSAAALGALAGCDDLLSVENPGAIEPDELNDPAYLSLLVNGVVGEFQGFYDDMTTWSAKFTDEFRNHHVYFEERNIDMRQVGEGNGTFSYFVWGPMHRARFMADTVATRLRTILADSATSDLRLARVLAYGGLTYTVLGEQLCQIPINIGPPHTPEEIFEMAIPKFDEAISIATAARARAAAITPATAASTATIAGADSIIALAQVGAARAALNGGNMSEAVSYATAVEPAYVSNDDQGFRFWSQYLENTSSNRMWAAIATSAGAGNRHMSLLYTPFDSIVDPRIPVERKPVMNAEGAPEGPWVPNAPSSYSSYDGTLVGADITMSDWVRVASALEARYIQAEAQGLTPENVDFLNERRAVGSRAALVDPTAAEYMEALRIERSIDLFADGHRMGDLRRYDTLYPNRTDNLWQTGPYPGSTTGETYGEERCWPTPLSELQGNPNY